MSAVGELLVPGLALFSVSVLLTAASLWIAGRLAPWFLQEAVERPTVRSYFLDPMAEAGMTRARVVTMLIATGIMLFALLIIAIAVKFGGVALL
jgi:hypothetical protein